jgi:hypothetical protein
MNSTLCSFNCSNSATFKCRCKQPAVPLCASCIANHFQTQANTAHLIVPIEPTVRDPSEPCCQECQGGLDKPTMICLCNSKKTLLCKQCCSVHIERNPAASHIFERIENSRYLNSEDDVKDYLLRNRIIDLLSSQLEVNFSTLTVQKQNLYTSKQTLIQQIEQIFDEKMSEIQEVEDTMYAIEIQLKECRLPTNSLDTNSWVYQLLRSCTLKNINEEVKKMKVVVIDMDIQGILNELDTYRNYSQFAKRPFKENISYFKPDSDELYLYDVKSEKSVKLVVEESEKFCYNAGWCSLPNGDLFYCGGFDKNRYSNRSFILSLPDLKLRNLPNMRNAREGHAICYYSGGIYVFGGYNGNIISYCEKFDMEKDCWINLPCMSEARYWFTSALSDHKIYIGGGNPTNTIEIFDPHTCSFSLLTVKLPYYNQHTILSFIKDTILIFQREKLSAYEPGRNEIVELAEISDESWWSNMNSVEFEGFLYILHSSGQVWKLDPQSLETKRVIQLY